MSETPASSTPTSSSQASSEATGQAPAWPHVYVSDLQAHVEKPVEVRGWLYNRSSKGKLHFLQIRDGSGIVQAVVFKGDVDEATFHRADHLPQETALVVRGNEPRRTNATL